MDDTLIDEIKAFIQRHPPPERAADAMHSAEDFHKLGFTPRTLFPVASKGDVSKAEADIGFPLPELLRRLFLEVSNGIAGFAYEIMGLEGGCSSDTGTIVEAYITFKTSDAWKAGMLPFCNWGCAIYSCVDCADSSYPVFTYENYGVWAEQYTLSQFFEMWLKGKVLFSEENVEIVTTDIINPFTGKKTTASARRRVPRS